MSEEMAVNDNTPTEDVKTSSENVELEAAPVEAGEAISEAPTEAPAPNSEENPESEEPETKTESKDDQPSEDDIQLKAEDDDAPMSDTPIDSLPIDDKRSLKRRASTALSDIEESEEFKGFDKIEESSLEDYTKVVERLEAEVTAAVKSITPLRTVRASSVSSLRASKRPRQDTDGSRPSSALSSRSDGDGAGLTDASMSPAGGGGGGGGKGRGRGGGGEMGSPLLRVPLERGWRRELVYRAAADPHSRRMADIYYYTPAGKKLRSSREVSDHLSGTGLTLENFSFFKEPLGIDDPEKEIIRDAKVIRRAESPVPAPVAVVEGKRTPKPKAPKGASPEPPALKSPPAKLKVKSVGSRLSNNATPPTAVTPKQPRKQPPQSPATAPAAAATATVPAATVAATAATVAATVTAAAPAAAADNNNSAAWKKPRPAPPALQSRPPAPPPPPAAAMQEASRQVVQPCSMTCGRGVPSLACAACLCLYHPACVAVGGGQRLPADTFYCKNCRKSASPPVEPPPLTHKSALSAGQAAAPPPALAPPPPPAAQATPLAPAPPPAPRRLVVPVPVPVPVPAKVARGDKRVTLRMKVAGGGPDGSRVWAVTKGPAAATSTTAPPPGPGPGPGPGPSPAPAAPAPRSAPPQALAVLNGRRFIVVPRSLVHAANIEKGRGRIANGASPPPEALASPRRRGRPRLDSTDHFAAFCKRARADNYNVAVQIFQYLGMRELARCARVCKLWRELASTPALWRHVRMKNSHVSDWGGLCAALKRHGTKWLDLRKMLLPQNDTLFWDQFAEHIGSVDTLERLELCRCPARAVEEACRRVRGLRALAAPAIRDARLDPAPLAHLPRLELLRLKSLTGLSLSRDLRPLAALTRLQHLSLTSIKELGWCACEVVGQLDQLESLELGECSFPGSFASALAKLSKLRRLRLERGVAHCAAPALLRALATLPKLTRLELVNFDVTVGFDDALAECKNIQRLLIIPTYVSQSATTNKQVLSGVLRLRGSLTHLMWGVTIELLRVTELFIDQCEAGAESRRRDVGECIPVLKPVPGCRLPLDHRTVAGPPQVEILPIPTLQRLLSAQLPNTKLKLLRIPFHATWRQSLADFQ